MRCRNCDKTQRNLGKGFTWIESRLCPPCFMEEKGLKKVKINQVGRKYTLVYISKEMSIL